jgi:sortase (surface protein transpeptidase)
MRIIPVRGGRGARIATAVAAIAVGCVTACTATSDLPARERPVPTAVPVVPAAAIEEAADPVRVRIPAVGVDASVVPLEVDPNGVLPPPPTNEEAGWWRSGPEPGEAGPAVVVGHVDSRAGPAVFFRLRQLVPGDEVIVEQADGGVARFVVQRTERHAKDAFPTEAVYGDTPAPQLRLITCGGEFDRSTRHYVDNVIVFAMLVG